MCVKILSGDYMLINIYTKLENLLTSSSTSLDATIFAFKTFITLLFFVPSMIVYLFVGYIVPVIISFVVLLYIALKQNNIFAVLSNVGLHLFMILSYFAINSNPGTDDTFANLDKVADSAVNGSIYTFIACIFLLIYIISVLYKYIKISKKNDTTANDKYCINCNTINKINNKYCSKCGAKL